VAYGISLTMWCSSPPATDDNFQGFTLSADYGAEGKAMAGYVAYRNFTARTIAERASARFVAVGRSERAAHTLPVRHDFRLSA
jgi:hypothetical protein